jgi:hypothetical protein
VPTVLATVAAEDFSGPLMPQIQEVFPDIKPIDRTAITPGKTLISSRRSRPQRARS